MRSDLSPRVGLALDGAGLSLPPEGQILLLNPGPSVDLTALPTARCVAVQPFLPDQAILSGMQVVPELGDAYCDHRFAAAFVFLPRSKPYARALIAQAMAVTDGVVAVDGAKTDGIESILKELRRQVDPLGVLSKAHGKILWFRSSAPIEGWIERANDIDGFRTLPGVFSADGVDPGSALLANLLPDRLGRHVVDLGAGWGWLSSQFLRDPSVAQLDLVEADHRALSCARANVKDARARFHWADARVWRAESAVDTVVMNPPFHTGRAADPELGQAFVATAARLLSPAGQLWLVANRQLPYEAVLERLFTQTHEVGGDGRFKVLRAERPSRPSR